jgi:putative flippase GtrA
MLNQDRKVTGPLQTTSTEAVVSRKLAGESSNTRLANYLEHLAVLARRGKRVIRYSAVSLLALGVSEVTLLLLVGNKVGATVAAIVANLAGTVPSYLLSRYWIWSDAERERVGRQVVLYWLTSALSMLISSAATGLCSVLIRNTGTARLVLLGGTYLGISLVLWVAKYAVYQYLIFPTENRATIAGGDLLVGERSIEFAPQAAE